MLLFLSAEYPYGKLPVLEENGKKLSQSFAIARYLAKKFNLNGADDFEAAKCDEYTDVVKDVLKGKETKKQTFPLSLWFQHFALWSTY